MKISELIKHNWRSVSNLGLCEIDGCFEEPKDFIVLETEASVVYYLCDKHFREYLQGAEQYRSKDNKKMGEL